MRALFSLGTHTLAASALLASLCAPGAARAQSGVTATAPDYTDVAERGLRLRADLWGREVGVGQPHPPVRLEIDERNDPNSDFDLGGLVLLGWDRPFGVPVVGDFAGDAGFDADGEEPPSIFTDYQSAAPRARIYSAFIGLSGRPGEIFEPFKLNLGRMTQMADSPVTYDGVAGGVDWRIARVGRVSAKVWGGIDAPQRLAQDPFTRTAPEGRAYSEKYVDDSGFISPTGGLTVQRTAINEPILNAVGGVDSDGRVFGIGWKLQHTLYPTVQRSLVGASYDLDHEYFWLHTGLKLKASDFLPRAAGVDADVMTQDGATRVGARVDLQFAEDVCAYDCSYRAFNPAGVLVKADAEAIEQVRVVDQIRHLNIGPPQENIAVMVDGERQLIWGFSVLAHGRLRQHFDDADLDMFRTNVLEGGGGLSWSNGMALEAGDDVTFGQLNSGTQTLQNFDTLAEGIQNYVENRTWVRTVLVEGKLSHLAEVFVRRADVSSRSLDGQGQWSGAFASSVRYDIFDLWSVSARVDADALSPFDALNASTYLGGMVATSVRF